MRILIGTNEQFDSVQSNKIILDDTYKIPVENGHFYMRLQHAMLFGIIENYILKYVDDSVLENWQTYIEEARFFNNETEVHLFYSMNNWNERIIHHKDDYKRFETSSYVLGTQFKEDESKLYLIATEDRGTVITIPISAISNYKEQVTLDNKRIQIIEHHYIDKTPIIIDKTPIIVDKSIVKFKIV